MDCVWCTGFGNQFCWCCNKGRGRLGTYCSWLAHLVSGRLGVPLLQGKVRSIAGHDHVPRDAMLQLAAAVEPVHFDRHAMLGAEGSSRSTSSSRLCAKRRRRRQDVWKRTLLRSCTTSPASSHQLSPRTSSTICSRTHAHTHTHTHSCPAALRLGEHPDWGARKLPR
jgi:hypothetical protein